MTTLSVFSLSRYLHTADGVVVGPAWTDDRSRELLRALRSARPAAPGAYQEGSAHSSDDFAVAARIFHEVLSLHPGSDSWPVFAGGNCRPSLFKSAVLHCQDLPEMLALSALDEDAMKLAANVARWLLGQNQQTDSTLVFVSAPTLPPRLPAPRPKVEAQEVAAVA